MIGNVLKIVATLIVGYLVGLLCGGALGILVGLLPSVFFQQIVHSDLSIVVSILLTVVLGGLLGYVEVLMFNRLANTHDKPLIGSGVGAVLGLLFGVFGFGVLDVSNAETFNASYVAVSLIYSGAVGSRIGEIIFPLFSVVTTLREMAKPYEPIRKLG